MHKKQRYEMEPLPGPFGYRREGGGRVVFLFTQGLDFDAIEQVVSYAYDEYVEDDDGEEVLDFSEYDDGILYTEMAGDLETEMGEELSCEDIVKRINGDDPAITKFEGFLRQEVLAKGIPLIFIDSDKKKISQIDEDSIGRVVEKHKERLSVNIREYDHIDDY